jgi:histidyl-tRNA synthetase
MEFTVLKFKSITGTRDILPPETYKWHWVEENLRKIFESYSYNEIRTPIFEETNLFARGIGQNTDIVGKEMYTFIDKGGDSLTLRPELTASVIRAYIQHNLGNESLLNKFYYIGPVFRQERPQAGRYRQFHQFGLEALGSQHPSIDAEIISIAVEIYNFFKVEDFNLKINSIGCPKCRTKYKEILQSELLKVKSQLSAESQKRIELNPLRVLDSKDERDKEATKNAPILLNYLCEECNTHFETLKKYLDELEIKYTVDGRIVRGLDYYTKTAFEIITKSLGSQDALAGGGRYDLLAEELGGNPTPGIGFASGMERLILMLEKQNLFNIEDQQKSVFIVSVDDYSRPKALRLAANLRKENIKTDLDFNLRSVKAQFREANKKNAKIVIVVSKDELETGELTLKNMSTGEQNKIKISNIINEIKKI